MFSSSHKLKEIDSPVFNFFEAADYLYRSGLYFYSAVLD